MCVPAPDEFEQSVALKGIDEKGDDVAVGETAKALTGVVIAALDVCTTLGGATDCVDATLMLRNAGAVADTETEAVPWEDPVALAERDAGTLCNCVWDAAGDTVSD